MKLLTTFIVLIFIGSKLSSDDLLNPYMDQSEYSVFAQQVSDAVSDHPEYLSSLDSLKAAGANLKGSKSNLLPQIRLIVDSNNQLDKSFEDGSNNLFEKSRSDHKTDATITVANCFMTLVLQAMIFLNLKLCLMQKRAELSSTILDLIYRSVINYINVAAYTIFTNTINDSYERHTAIKQRIEQKLKEDCLPHESSAEHKLDNRGLRKTNYGAPKS